MTDDLAVRGERSVLADGTRLEDLFDLERRRVSARVYTDPEIFDLEMSRVFARSWLFVGLESEIPNPGDYVVRPMGSDSVIVTRDGAGGVNILLNRCTHRGTQLCVTDSGQAKRFKCPYHGWSFAHDGRLESMPQQKQWLGPNGDKADYSLPTARVATRGGLIFGTWDVDLPDFETYLGDFRFYFDMVFCSLDKHLVALGPPQRWTVPFNWKVSTENSVGDGYHLQSTHASMADIGLIPTMTDSMVGAVGAEPRWGHGFLAPFTQSSPSLESTLPFLPQEVLPQLEDHLNPEQLTLLRNGTPTGITTIFPNMTWSFQYVFFFLRIWQPVAPGKIEMWTWTITHPDATDEQNLARDRGVNLTFGVTGMLAQDDLAICARIQRAARGVIGSQQFVSFGTNGAPDKRGYLSEDGEWPGPGDVWLGFPSDDPIWNFYMRWLHLMSGDRS
jgi:nitrite reductase/ring-hydroxylating ferredoxin subunit